MRFIATLLILCISTLHLVGQTTVTYYKSSYLRKEVEERKAVFRKTVTHQDDGIVTEEVIHIPTQSVYSFKAHQGDKPVGVWKGKENGKTWSVNFNDTSIYVQPLSVCDDKKQLGTNDSDSDDPSVGYVAPRSKDSSRSILWGIATDVVYPMLAKEWGITGVVYVSYKILADGSIADVYVVRGANLIIDKAAYKVIKDLKVFPATLNGKPVETCVITPISFKLQ